MATMIRQRNFLIPGKEKKINLLLFLLRFSKIRYLEVIVKRNTVVDVLSRLTFEYCKTKADFIELR